MKKISLLRGSLVANALFSAVSGLALILFDSRIYDWLQPPQSISLQAIGLLLLLYSVSLAWNASRQNVNRKQVWSAIALDLAWVAGSVILITLGFFGATGNWVVGIIADIVLLFAILQFVGLRKTAIALFLLILVNGNTASAADESPLLDIRPESIQTIGFTPELRKQGKDLLEHAAEEHGWKAWKNLRTMEVRAIDEWISTEFGWWKEKKQKFRSLALLDTFTSRMELLEGPEHGAVLGIQSWKAYRHLPGGKLESVRDKRIEFYLPTLQYFNELPFRILRAPVIAHAGTASIADRHYQLVFASWDEEPSAKVDQYTLWIDATSHRIEYIHYTVREGRPDVDGTMHFEDFRRIDGVLVPFVQTVTVGDPPGNRNPFPSGQFFHQLRIESCTFYQDLDPILTPFQDKKMKTDSKEAKLPLPAAP